MRENWISEEETEAKLEILQQKKRATKVHYTVISLLIFGQNFCV